MGIRKQTEHDTIWKYAFFALFLSLNDVEQHIFYTAGVWLVLFFSWTTYFRQRVIGFIYFQQNQRRFVYNKQKKPWGEKIAAYSNSNLINIKPKEKDITV